MIYKPLFDFEDRTVWVNNNSKIKITFKEKQLLGLKAISLKEKVKKNVR